MTKEEEPKVTDHWKALYAVLEKDPNNPLELYSKITHNKINQPIDVSRHLSIARDYCVENLSYEEIAKKWNVTPWRIKQIVQMTMLRTAALASDNFKNFYFSDERVFGTKK